MIDLSAPRALADALEAHMDGRRVRAAVFLTFTFEPDFFELYILPTLLPRLQLSPLETTALWQLEDALRMSIGDVAVYYDRRALVPRERSARLDIRRIPCAVPNGGYFHPKVLLAVTEPDGESDAEDQLVVLVSSANLTQAGWWENVETAHIEVAEAESRCSFRDDLLHLIKQVRKAAPQGTDHRALDQVHAFIRRLQPRLHSTTGGVLYPRLFTGQAPLAEWLLDLVPRGAEQLKLEVISPYFDETDARPLRDLVEGLEPNEVRVFLPEAPDGTAACRHGYFQAVTGMNGVSWGRLPASLLSFGKGDRFKRRTVHAKAYHFFDRRSQYEAAIVGSANLTTAAHGRGGNLEAAFLVEAKSRSPVWWLTPLDAEPSGFAAPGLEEDPPFMDARLAMRFDWSAARAEAFWEDREASGAVEVTAQGAPLFVLDALPPRAWAALAPEQAEQLEASLRSTAFLRVREAAGEYTILVDEVGMAARPSLRHELTVADILKSWSLFTPEQRSAFIEEKGAELAEAGMLPPPVLRPESFFDLQAGIFLAFGSLERRILEAIGEDRRKELEYWLFGRQYDSLLTLLERSRDESEKSPVRHYLVLLCAKQLVTQLCADHSFLRQDYRDGLAPVERELSTLSAVRERFDFDDAEHRNRFLDWFEKWFLARAIPVEVS